MMPDHQLKLPLLLYSETKMPFDMPAGIETGPAAVPGESQLLAKIANPRSIQ